SEKGGVQGTVEVRGSQLDRIGGRGEVGELMEMIRAKVEPETFAEYELRVHDLFTQQVCWAKLDLAIQGGITQENQTIPAESFQRELDELARARADAIRQAILTELDV